MKNAKEFMLLFRFTPDFAYQLTAAEEAEQQQQWGGFIGNLAMQEKLVYTHQLGFEGKKVNAAGEVEEGLYMSQGQILGGNLVVTANGMEEAIDIAKGCPILTMGGEVEVREVLPMS